MPQLIATALTPLLSNLFLAIGATGLAFGAPLAAVALGVGYIVFSAGLMLVSSLFQQTTATAATPPPVPENGRSNLQQNVPPLEYALGRVKKGGNYAFFEETGGTAYDIIVDAAHRIEGYVAHYLYDELITLDGSGNVPVPPHFNGYVTVKTRLGLNAETAYAEAVAAFPSIWTADHRGDGLATRMIISEPASADDFRTVYPQGPETMRRATAIIDGGWLLDPRLNHDPYDPDSWSFSTNLALMQLWHLIHPVGAKVDYDDDIYAPDWAHAADVADQQVLDRNGSPLARYHGGYWFTAANDPVAIGKIFSEATDNLVYERSDGRIGVHAGEYVEPDVRLTTADLKSVYVDFNDRVTSQILAVRGRYTEPTKGFATVDAGIYGDPYEDSTERTKTVANPAVQHNNHSARLQVLAYERSRAPRVKIVAHYEPARRIPYQRFFKVHCPEEGLDEAVIELSGRPKLSLRQLHYEIEGVVWSRNFYDFDAAQQEGAPGSSVTPVVREDITVPEGFAISIVEDGGGLRAEAGFDLQSGAFAYEVQWQPTAGGLAQSVKGIGGAIIVRTDLLAEGTEYRFRARTWSAEAYSDWTDYEIETAEL